MSARTVFARGVLVEDIWKRLAEGHHVAALGLARVGVPAQPLHLIRVDCSAGRQLGPLVEAQRRVEVLLDAPIREDDDRTLLGAAIRQRLFGDREETGDGDALVSALNRLRDQSDQPVVIAFQSVDQADGATLRFLARVVRRKGWVRAPFLFAFASARPSAAAEALVEAVREIEGDESVVRIAKHDQKKRGKKEKRKRALRALDPEALHVLRAGAVVGDSFEVDIVARLLNADVLDVLYLVQTAIDQGVPLEDGGDGCIRMDPELAEDVRAGVMPSLARAWHARLADLLGGEPQGLPRVLDPTVVEPPAPPERPPDGGAEPLPRPAYSPVAEPEARPEVDRWARGVDDREAPATDESRAAQHAEAMGDADLAAKQYLAAASRAGAMGAFEQVLELAPRALEIVEKLPESPRRRRVRITAMAELARAHWQASGHGPEYSLDGALAKLDECKRLLRADDPVELRAGVRSLAAGVGYDLGTKEALERALEDLTEANRLLMDAGRSLEAARLLNDEAAVWVRIGDPVRANHLLQKSSEVFSKLVPQNPVARAELAETHHLLGRLMLHVAPRPGKENEALQLGIERARMAADFYREVPRPRELARTLETIGRLETRAGRAQQALEILTDAAQMQQQLGDVLGLARTIAALSELLGEAGDHERALGLLHSSISMNAEKGSPVGLAYNRRTLRHLTKDIPSDAAVALRSGLREVLGLLETAEKKLGRVELPSGGAG